jgi:hypothetical protein
MVLKVTGFNKGSLNLGCGLHVTRKDGASLYQALFPKRLSGRYGNVTWALAHLGTPSNDKANNTRSALALNLGSVLVEHSQD